MSSYFKAFDSDLRCRGFQFAVGETFEHAGKVSLCGAGFHACKRLHDVFDYYPKDPKRTRVCEVELAGEVIDGEKKSVGQRVTVLREIPYSEIEATEAAALKDQAAEELIKHLADYFWAEIGWEYFRAEFLANKDKEYETTRLNNAHAMTQFMQATVLKYPEWAKLLRVT